MPLIATRGAASAQGFGFFRLSALGGYYYKISTIDQYYQPQFTGVQPLSSGWMTSGYRGNGNRFAATLDSAGNLSNYAEDSSNYFFDIRTMSQGGPRLLSTGFIPAWITSGQDKLAFISTTPSYNGVPGGKIVPAFASVGVVLGIDYDNNYVISNGSYSDGESINYGYIAATNATTRAGVWVKRYNIGSPWNYSGPALVRPGDTTNVWVQIGYDSFVGYALFNRSTGARTASYYVSGASTNNAALGFVTDPSGNLYTGTYNGQIWRMNTSNTIDWGRVYSDAANSQNFGYTYLSYYDGYLYFFSSQHPNGNYIGRINPSDGSIDWAIKITQPLYAGSGISVSANGIMVVGADNNSSGFQAAYLLNYPLTGGITGTKGDFIFSNMTVSSSSLSLTVNSTTGPTLTDQSAPASSTYPSSLNASSSILGSKVVI